MSGRPSKPFERRWSAAQQAALAHAMLDAKPTLSAPKASAAALNGTLPGVGAELEPFGPVPVSTCHSIRRRELEGRQVQARGRLAKAGSSANAAAIVYADAWDELDRAREQTRRAKLSGAERARALRELVTTAQTITRAERELTGEKPSKPTPSTTDEKPAKRQRTEADDLARAARKRAQTEHTTHPSTQAAQRETEPGTDRSSSEDATEHATDSQERVRSSEGTQLARSLAQTAA